VQREEKEEKKRGSQREEIWDEIKWKNECGT